jgi:2-oxoglutarate dehydrogenase E1 component
MQGYSYLNNAESEYIESLYEAYSIDPSSVDPGWRKFFEGFELASTLNGKTKQALSTVSGSTEQKVEKEAIVWKLINAYRERAHLLSTTNPLKPRRDRHPHLDLEDFGLTSEDLPSKFDGARLLGLEGGTLEDIINHLQKLYCRNIGVEFMHINNKEQRDWFKSRYESTADKINYPLGKAKRILTKLNEAVVFENFLSTKYVGQKRFSLEGGETTIPALDAIINKSSELGVEEIIIGMAHRGRLNVLANILGKTYEYIFSEFEGNQPNDITMGDGDVKYHLGFSSKVETEEGNYIYLKLSANPSHLEAVDPVVQGFARCKADLIYEENQNKVLPILIHGDAALAGQGVVYEVAQMSQLPGYFTGGTIHFVINNQIGFTTDWDEARSSTYCTGVAMVTESPVFHVNGDDPEAVVFCVEMATDFRMKFNKDVYIDMVCYRRHGHNEGDEPKYTQPALYNLISKHANPREIYIQTLISRGEIEAELAKKMEMQFKSMLQDRLNMVKQKPIPYTPQPPEVEWLNFRKATADDFTESPDTAVPIDMLKKITDALTIIPDTIHPIKKAADELIKRKNSFEQNALPWAMGELLAYGSLLLEGNDIRMSGQDVIRGTFSHRHAEIWDEETGESYCNLNHIQDSQAKFRIYNSLLSEYAVLGFEYGYSFTHPNGLSIWEAQFGDFSNGAQVMIDQFISSGESKWARMSGIVLLLPHGYEGQGAEHSSARPERFLDMAAELNMVIANCTTPANFFHLIRRQMKWPFRKPLVVFTPKSLLRHPLAVSPLEDFTKGKFQELIGDNYVTKSKVKRVLFCSGKIYYDLFAKQQADARKDVAIVRIEQLYPMPDKQIEGITQTYPKAEYVWIQEEPKNMGAWTYLLRRPEHMQWRLISRKASASPAVGFSKTHQAQQKELVDAAFEI